jgi:magnesium transporter
MIQEYNQTSGKAKESNTLSDLKTKKPIWIDCLAPSKTELAKLSENSGIELEELKESLDEGERPRVIDTKYYSVIIFKAPLVKEDEIETTPISIFLSKTKNNVITLRLKDMPAVDRIKQHMLIKNKFLEKGVVNFVYRLLDEIINAYFIILDRMDDKIDKIEDKLMGTPKRRLVEEIFTTKKTLIYFYRGLRANREVLTSIVKEYAVQIQKADIKPFSTLYYDTIQLVDTVGTYRDILTGMLDIYLSSVSNNLNIVMKKITGWGALILVPTLISGIYGMNFKYMPELYWKYGYFFALGLMVVSVTIMLIYFKRKDWL